MQGKRVAAEDKGKGAPKSAAEREAALREEKRARRKKIAYRSLVALLALLLALLIGVAAWWKVFIQRPILPDPPAGQGAGENPGAIAGDLGSRKKEFFTFLVIGRDTGGGGNTDTILLAAYDIPNQKLNMMSIPRDTMVNVPWEIKRINSVYNYYGGKEEGIQALDEEVSQLVGFIPDFQLVLEWKAVGELVDALGGVSFDVPQNMYYRDPTQNLTINLKKGKQVLSGDLAMQLVRYRSYPSGDLGRIEVQQAFLKEVVRACLKIENMTKVNALIKVFKENVTTNLNVNELAWFADKAIFGGLRMENVNFFTMPNSPASIWSNTYRNYQSYVVPLEAELVELVNRYLNPYQEALDPSALDIMSVTGGVISSSTGKLEDPAVNSRKPSGAGRSETGQPAENKGETAQSGQTGGGTAEGGGAAEPPQGDPQGSPPEEAGQGEAPPPTEPAPEPPAEMPAPSEALPEAS